MNKVFRFMKRYEAIFSHVFTLIGLAFIAYQLYQSNKHKRWENYNSLNLRYYELYSSIPEALENDSCKPFEDTPAR